MTKLTRIIPAVALVGLAACAGSESGRYNAASGKLDSAQARLDKASAELLEAQRRCTAEVSDDCVSQAERLSAELQDAKAARDAAGDDIAAAKKAQAEAFGRGLAVMEEAQKTP